MSRPHKIQDEFTDLPISNRRKYQMRRKRDGLCVTCGQPRNLYWAKCDACQEKIRVTNRINCGHEPWQPGRPGRPPACHSIKNPIRKAA